MKNSRSGKKRERQKWEDKYWIVDFLILERRESLVSGEVAYHT